MVKESRSANDVIEPPEQEAGGVHNLSNTVSEGCNKKVIIKEEGNKDYAWFYIYNLSHVHAQVTVDKSWIYNGNRIHETIRLSLYPGQRKNVYNMDRKQSPLCKITVCTLDKE